jgi:prepilin-type processing-associated H-X9-DG protein
LFQRPQDQRFPFSADHIKRRAHVAFVDAHVVDSRRGSIRETLGHFFVPDCATSPLRNIPAP